jgi:hypothetical protein
MGGNSYGMLGTKDTTSRSTPTLIASNVAKVAAQVLRSFYLTTDGKLYGMGYSYYIKNADNTYDYTPQLVASDVADVDAGASFGFYITTNGDLYAIGANSDGQLGNGTTRFASTPQKIAENVISATGGSGHSLYLTSSCKSAYWPCYTAGAKWDGTRGWIDDTYFPWVWSYLDGNWYYVYDDTDALPAYRGYWIFYYSPDASNYGWGYVMPGYGWWCLDTKLNATWIDANSPMAE